VDSPSHPKDSRDLDIGTFNPNHADGGARMHFQGTDSVGHAVVEVKLRGGARKGEVKSVALRIPIQTAAIDSFVSQVKKIEKESARRLTCSGDMIRVR
jgi:hypothetical protein